MESLMRQIALKDFAPLPEGKDQYPLEFIENTSSLKLHEDGESVTIGLCDTADLGLRDRLEAYHRKHVKFLEIDRAELAIYLGRLSGGYQDSGEKGPAGVEEDELSPNRTTISTEEEEKLLLDRLAHDAPVVNLVNNILMEGISRGSSDIHIESFRKEVRVRYRIDGALSTVSLLRPELFRAVSSRIKIIANLNIMERRLPQDGRITANIGGKSVDMRISIVPIANGESIVLRLFNRQDTLFSLAELGLPPDQTSVLESLATYPHGLFLVTGPTGSGKTTTLNALLRGMYDERRKIISIEDPVEYVIDGIDQIQTNDRIGLTFESLLRRVLRQDPDVIMVGEIRDTETAQLAVRASLTGHLVLSTLHTNDAVSTVGRLTDMQVPRYLVAAVLRGCMAQRLVRRLCPACRTERSPTTEERFLFEAAGVQTDRVWEGVGCEACSQRGYRGRLAVAEMFRADPAFERLIASGAEIGDLAQYQVRNGMRTLRQSGFSLAAAGLTSIDEAKAVSY